MPTRKYLRTPRPISSRIPNLNRLDPSDLESLYELELGDRRQKRPFSRRAARPGRLGEWERS
jgi:hypothetical protein